MKRKGVDALEAPVRGLADALLAELREYGLFVVPGGELETWLAGLDVPGHGNAWLVDLFGRIGSTADAPSYVRPGAGDVWQFLDTVATWVRDPARRGMD